jgi:NAD(P)-dependent dehydrogenase (short-subunit alcohol dehydrogenase family)
MSRLADQVTIVTGGANGIGAATARRFAAEGARVVVSDIDRTRGQAIAVDIGGAFVAADVTCEADVARLVEETVRLHGRLDCMINNAGVLGPVASIADIEADQWNATISILLSSVYFGMKHSAPQMIRQGSGVILTTASIAGLVALGPHAYTAAKHGVVGLTKSVASELAAHGVRVNAVAPGTVPTELTGSMLGGADGVRRTAAAKNPLGYTVEPEEIAGAFAYLASADARSITGQIWAIDAGMTACPTAVRSPPPPRYGTSEGNKAA